MSSSGTKKQPNILVITVPAWNSKVGSNTWETLLEDYDSSHIASLCIRDEAPDSKVCGRYFSISENKVLKSLWHWGLKTGKEVQRSDSPDVMSKDLLEHNARYYRMTRKTCYPALMAREVVWYLGNWKTRELDEFLDSFKPDIILHCMDKYVHLNRIIDYALNRTHAKAIGYIWDDTFTYRQSSKIGYKILRYFHRRSLFRLARRTQAFFAISELTKKEADQVFGISCHWLTKPLNAVPQLRDYSATGTITFMYSGNLLYGRTKSLRQFVRVAKTLPPGALKLDVYTQTQLSEEERQELTCECCAIHAPIPQEQILQKQKETDVLLFLEDTDRSDGSESRLSFSTKITDYLSAGCAIFALGRKDIAPMHYFIANEAAMVAETDEEIREQLTALCGDRSRLTELAQKAMSAGLRNHDKAKIKAIFHEVMDEVIGADA